MMLNAEKIGKSDTAPEAQRMVNAIYRDMPVAQKWQMLAQMWNDAQRLHATGVRMRQPDASQDEIHRNWLEQILDPEDLARIRNRVCDG